MSSFTIFLEDEILNRYFRDTTVYVPVAQLYIALYSVAPIESGGGTELSGGGYTRMPVTFTAPVAGVIENTADVTFPTATGAPWSIAAFAIVDALVDPSNMLGYKATSATIAVGNRARFPAGGLTVSLD